LQFELRNEEGDSNELKKSDEEVEQMTLVVRRSERVRKPVKRYSPPNIHFEFVLTATDEEPKSVREAFDSAEGKIWKDSMVNYMESLHNNETWDLV
jgi:hypothetical protein